MRILLTNDDGIYAPGLEAMYIALENIKHSDGGMIHEVWIVAPETERSGVSHAMTLKKPTKVRKFGEKKYSCSGTPADCIIVAGIELLDERPDLVISGINRGPNLGTDIVYSGTCGAARQAALVDIPAIAVSCASITEPLKYRASASFVADNLESLRSIWKRGTFININGPSSDEEAVKARWAIPGKNRYNDNLRCFEGADGYLYCFMTEGRNERQPEDFSDHSIVAEGDIAISLIDIHPRSAQEISLNGKILNFEPTSPHSAVHQHANCP
jgi:5'-nucleotidase